MSAIHSPAMYIRPHHELEPDHCQNPSFGEPLLGVIEESSNNADGMDVVDVLPKKSFRGSIQVKQHKSDNSTDDSTSSEEDMFLYQQFRRGDPIEEDTVVILNNNLCLSPTTPSAKALIHCIHTIDFTFGSFLITRGLLEMRDEYSTSMCSLVIGMLLLSGSLAGAILHSPLRTLCWVDGGDDNTLLVRFNVAFAIISFGVYYVLSLLLLTSTKVMEPLVGSELGLASQIALCLLGFTLSLGESYRVMFLQYDHQGGEESMHSSLGNSNTTGTISNADSDDNIVENAEAVLSIYFV